jgi:hypothetical protein
VLGGYGLLLSSLFLLFLFALFKALSHADDSHLYQFLSHEGATPAALAGAHRALSLTPRSSRAQTPSSSRLPCRPPRPPRPPSRTPLIAACSA